MGKGSQGKRRFQDRNRDQWWKDGGECSSTYLVPELKVLEPRTENCLQDLEIR
jgi:hypothetical protein